MLPYTVVLSYKMRQNFYYQNEKREKRFFSKLRSNVTITTWCGIFLVNIWMASRNVHDVRYRCPLEVHGGNLALRLNSIVS